MEAKYLRVSAACQIYSLSRNTIYRMIDRGDIDCDRTPGGHRRISKASLDEYFTKMPKKVIAMMESLGL